jgi:hypothetical protein
VPVLGSALLAHANSLLEDDRPFQSHHGHLGLQLRLMGAVATAARATLGSSQRGVHGATSSQWSSRARHGSSPRLAEARLGGSCPPMASLARARARRQPGHRHLAVGALHVVVLKLATTSSVKTTASARASCKAPRHQRRHDTPGVTPRPTLEALRSRHQWSSEHEPRARLPPRRLGNCCRCAAPRYVATPLLREGCTLRADR